MSIVCFPQISTGVMAQYPLTKSLSRRCVVNAMPGGTVIRAGDPDAYTTVWELRYTGLTDAERAMFESFFESMEGRLRTFLFLDPMANLLRWSGDFSQDVWIGDGLLQTASGRPDPRGADEAWVLTNASQVAQGIRQTVAAPAELRYVLSCYVRSESNGRGTLAAGQCSAEFQANESWQRILCTGVPGSGDEVLCMLSLEAGAVVDVYGLQLEPQPMPSAYKRSAQVAGVYTAARFDQDRLDFTAHGIDDHAVTIRILSRAGD